MDPTSVEGSEDVVDLEGHDDQMGVKLKQALDLNDLKAQIGTTFEIDMDEVQEQRKYFDPEEIFRENPHNHLPDWAEEEGEEDGDGTAFEVMSSKMEDISPAQDGGVYKKILQKGIGSVVPPSAFIKAHFDGYLEYADEPFDSSRLQNCVKKIRLGKGECVVGLELGLSTMKKSEIAQFILKPEYAFGKLGCPPRIPAMATVLFQVELVDFTDKSGTDEFFSLPHEERKEADWKLVRKVVETEKKEGNDFWKKKIYDRALGKYKKAIEILENYHAKGDEDDSKRQKELKSLYQNAGLACLRLQKPGFALQYARDTLDIDDKTAKAFYIRGKAFRQQHHFDAAKIALQKAHRLKPDDPDIQNAQKDLEKELKKRKLMEKETCQRMFGVTDLHKTDDPEEEVEEVTHVNEDFVTAIKESLQSFIDADDQTELPMNCQDFSVNETAHIAKVVREMGCSISRQGEGRNKHLMIRKMTRA